MLRRQGGGLSGDGVCEESNDAQGGEGKESKLAESPNLSSLTTLSMKRRSKADICSAGWDSDTVIDPVQKFRVKFRVTF